MKNTLAHSPEPQREPWSDLLQIIEIKTACYGSARNDKYYNGFEKIIMAISIPITRTLEGAAKSFAIVHQQTKQILHVFDTPREFVHSLDPEWGNGRRTKESQYYNDKNITIILMLHEVKKCSRANN